MTGAIRKGSELPPVKGPRCRRCSRPVREDGHNGYCCQECAQSESEEMTHQHLRMLVLARDAGICCDCGTNCLELRAMADEFKAIGGKPWDVHVRLLVAAGFDRHTITSGSSFWELDHELESVAGGKNTLANAKTRCTRCHAAKSSSFASKRSNNRKTKRYGRG